MSKPEDMAKRASRRAMTADDQLNRDERLNAAEALVARLGAWAGVLTERLAMPQGPFFPSDGRLLADPTLRLPLAEDEAPTL